MNKGTLAALAIILAGQTGLRGRLRSRARTCTCTYTCTRTPIWNRTRD